MCYQLKYNLFLKLVTKQHIYLRDIPIFIPYMYTRYQHFNNKQEACRPDSYAFYNWLSDHSKFTKSQFKHCSKSFIWPLGSHIWSLFAQIHNKKLTKIEIRSSWSRFEHCSESLIWPLRNHIWSLFAPIHMKSWPKSKLGQVGVGSNIVQNHSSSL